MPHSRSLDRYGSGPCQPRMESRRRSSTSSESEEREYASTRLEVSSIETMPLVSTATVWAREKRSPALGSGAPGVSGASGPAMIARASESRCSQRVSRRTESRATPASVAASRSASAWPGPSSLTATAARRPSGGAQGGEGGAAAGADRENEFAGGGGRRVLRVEDRHVADRDVQAVRGGLQFDQGFAEGHQELPEREAGGRHRASFIRSDKAVWLILAGRTAFRSGFRR